MRAYTYSTTKTFIGDPVLFDTDPSYEKHQVGLSAELSGYDMAYMNTLLGIYGIVDGNKVLVKTHVVSRDAANLVHFSGYFDQISIEWTRPRDQWGNLKDGTLGPSFNITYTAIDEIQ